MRNKLKPCPLCGGEAMATEICVFHGDSLRTRIECVVCGLRLDWTQEFVVHERKKLLGETIGLDRFSTTLTAEEAWNRRADNDR